MGKVRYLSKIYEVAEQVNTGQITLTPIDIVDVMPVNESSGGEFVKAWLNSSTIQEVAEKTGKTPHQASAYAYWLKTKGYKLPRLSNAPSKDLNHRKEGK